MRPTPDEREQILRDWLAFAQTKVFAFRGISPEIYAALSPDYFRAIMDRSQISVSRSAPGRIVAAVVFEPIPDSNTVNVHWAWTHPHERNHGHQQALWVKSNLDTKNICATHLTVLAEKLIDKYNRSPDFGGWRYSPLSLYKEGTNADETQADLYQGQ